MNNSITPKRLRELRAALMAFHNAYISYLNAAYQVDGGRAEDELALRTEVSVLIPTAQAALNETSYEPMVLPPPAFGGPVLAGLGNLVFAHRAPGMQTMHPPLTQLIIDAIRQADAELADQERVLRRRRLSPLYWADRTMRALLGVPAYVLGLLFRVPPSRIDASPLGAVLRGLALAVQAAGVYVAGRGARLW